MKSPSRATENKFDRDVAPRGPKTPVLFQQSGLVTKCETSSDVTLQLYARDRYLTLTPTLLHGLAAPCDLYRVFSIHVRARYVSPHEKCTQSTVAVFTWCGKNLNLICRTTLPDLEEVLEMRKSAPSRAAVTFPLPVREGLVRNSKKNQNAFAARVERRPQGRNS